MTLATCALQKGGTAQPCVLPQGLTGCKVDGVSLPLALSLVLRGLGGGGGALLLQRAFTLLPLLGSCKQEAQQGV